MVIEKKIVKKEWKKRREFKGWSYINEKERKREEEEGKEGREEIKEEMRKEMEEMGIL